ncbi:Isocitrate lyase [Mycena kentingensis (nom. inval.)]|nr:Isocitrate lyase [Mycena kentingensis (nom. inval.)]
MTRVFLQDVVRNADGTTGIVMVRHSPTPLRIVLDIPQRCWADAEDVANHHPAYADPLMRPLCQGEVGVSFHRPRDPAVSNREYDRQILPESELTLVDRSFHPGDFCKRSFEDAYSGVVLDTRVEGKCEHVINATPVEGWVSLDQLSDREYAEVGDLVIFDDWVGQVIELYDEVLVETANNEIVRLPEIGSRLSVGERGPDILPPPTAAGFFGFILGNTRPSVSDTCVEIKHTVYALSWLAISQTLDPEESAQRRRPAQFWTGADLSKLTLLRSLADLEMRVGDRVTFKQDEELPFTLHGPNGSSKIVVKTFTVTETRTFVDILWQDGTKETVRSTELIPYLNPDEYDCWPGDWVIWSIEDERRAVIVQSVNAQQRTASVLVPETGKIELVSVLELDTHGASDPFAMVEGPTDGLGVRRGDFVFIHPEGRTNGAALARVPRIGEVESWVRDPPFVDNQLAGFRKELSDIGADIARRRGSENIAEGPILRPSPDNTSLTWIGEVTNVLLDGNVEVVHPNGVKHTYALTRLTKLYDGIDQLEDGMWDDGSEGLPPGEEGQWDWGSDNGSADDWGSNGYAGEDGDVVEIHGDEQDAGNDLVLSWPASAGPEDADMETPRGDDALAESILEAQFSNARLTDPDVPNDTEADAPEDVPLQDADEDSEETPWKRFEILPSAPVDHAYYATPPAQPTKVFMSRLTKEYRALSSSLPDSILVRAYEDRVDLIRCMIIGPEHTPYEDAPFVIDWMLDSNFPHSPPMAHFLSWTNGNGRVNPNLYEEGKVCLSILGTWAGDKNEIWNAARSSLLQAFVSIQGLVLVKEPWFCEPAYEKLRGTEEGIVNSRLYNEKAYVLSRGFVRRALEVPPGSLESEIEWLYYRQGRLEKVINDAQALIEKSKNEQGEEGDKELAVPRLTAGGIITLERTLVKLLGLRRG